MNFAAHTGKGGRSPTVSNARKIRCYYCGAASSLIAPAGTGKPCCESCASLTASLFTRAFDPDGAREAMIGQHHGEPRRKLLELPRFSIVVFLDAHLEISAMEIEAKGGQQILRCTCDGGQHAYTYINRDGGYHNHDEIRAGDGFDLVRLRKDIAATRANLLPPISAFLDRITGG